MVGGELTDQDYLISLRGIVGQKRYSPDDDREIFITIDNSQYGQPWLISIAQEGSPPRNDLIVRGLPYGLPNVWFCGRVVRSLEKMPKISTISERLCRDIIKK